MLKLRACPRCKGALLVERDHHGWYEHCLQCGYQVDLKNAADVTRQLIQEVRRE